MKSLILSLLIFSACSSKPAKEPQKYPESSPKINTTKPRSTDVTAEMLGNEVGSDYVAEIKFKEGSSKIPAAGNKKIQSLYQRASKKGGKIEEVRLVTWADEEYPSKENKQLPEWQQKLAEKRNDALEKTIKGINDDLKITKVSMAERAGRFEELTSPTSYEIKESMEDTEITSRSIIIFLLKK